MEAEAEIVGGAARAGAGQREIASTKRRKRSRVNKRFTIGHELLLLNTGVPLILSYVFVCVCFVLEFLIWCRWMK